MFEPTVAATNRRWEATHTGSIYLSCCTAASQKGMLVEATERWVSERAAAAAAQAWDSKSVGMVVPELERVWMAEPNQRHRRKVTSDRCRK